MKRFFKTICAFWVGMVLITQICSAKEIKFVQITDSHFAAIKSDYSQEEVEYSQTVLAKTVKDINSLKGVDFVVFTGDNIDKSNEDDLKAFLKVANKLKFPYYMIIGNHEVFKSQKFDKKEYLKVASRYSRCFKQKNPNYVFIKKGVVFIVVDGTKEVIPGPAGYYREATLKWLDKQLTKYKNDQVVLLQHFPIEAPCYNRTHTTYNVDAYKDVLNKHKNVIAIFSGHYHVNGEKMVDGVYHVSTPALVCDPHDYKIVEIDIKNKKDFKIYTQLRHAE